MSICDRFAAIPDDASLTIKPVWMEIDGELEEWVGLDVAGQPFAGLPREGFLAGIHHALHEMTDEDPPA